MRAEIHSESKLIKINYDRFCYYWAMDTFFFTLILLFGSASYAVGLRDIFTNKYAPSVFSRTVWLLLAVMSTASVIVSKSTTASVVLASIFLLGNAAICIASLFKGTRTFAKLEYVCLTILLTSGCVWLVFDTPLVSLVISLFAHFIGAIPTYRRVWEKPATESSGFWSLFFIASVLSICASWGEPLRLVMFPIYFALFDGSMTALSFRKLRSTRSYT